LRNVLAAWGHRYAPFAHGAVLQSPCSWSGPSCWPSGCCVSAWRRGGAGVGVVLAELALVSGAGLDDEGGAW